MHKNVIVGVRNGIKAKSELFQLIQKNQLIELIRSKIMNKKIKYNNKRWK